MSITLATGYTFIRDLLSDGDSIVTDAVLLRHVNDVYSAWKVASDDRPRLFTATQSGLTLAVNDRSKTTSLANIRQVLRIWRASSAGSTGTGSGDSLEWLEPWELISLQNELTDTGTPEKFSVERIGTDTEADQGKILFRFHPIPSTTFFYALEALVEPAAFTGSSDAPDLQDAECYGVYRVVAARIAPTMGYDDGYIDQIWRGVPELMQQALRVQEKGKGPRPRPQENPA